MICKRCGNTDPRYFYQGSKGIYCRRCICFRRILLEEEPASFDYEVEADVDEYTLAYELTPQQKKAADECLTALKSSDVLLHCVCGAGKTEIVLPAISAYLKAGLKVAYAISRREVVKELAVRFQKYFTRAQVVAIYGGHHDKLDGDLLVLTTHQLYRYYQSFDLLVLDEADAFPLDENETLMHIALNAARGRVIFSTATLSPFLKKILKERKYIKVELFLRPSYKPLVVPKLIFGPRFALFIALFFLLKKHQQKLLVFVSDTRTAVLLQRLYQPFFPCTYVYAALKERDHNIADFKRGKYRIIFATSVLERGITISEVGVIIVLFRKGLLKESNLIQMSGRVGRSIEHPDGPSYILTGHFDREVFNSIKFLRKANKENELYFL